MKSATAAPIIRPFTGRSLFWFAVLFCLSGLMINASWHVVPWIIRSFMAPNTITVVHATYDGRCGTRDVAAILAERCEGRPSCDIALDPVVLDGAMRTCAARLSVSWICGRNARDVKLAFVEPKAIASIACAADAREADR